MFEGQYTLIKRQVAEFYEVTERTIDNLIEKYNSDLTKNGYDIIRGKRLTDFKLVFAECFDGEMDFIVKINTSLSCDSVNLGYLESTLELMQVDDYSLRLKISWCIWYSLSIVTIRFPMGTKDSP